MLIVLVGHRHSRSIVEDQPGMNVDSQRRFGHNPLIHNLKVKR
jgi:hypothetical protein